MHCITTCNQPPPLCCNLQIVEKEEEKLGYTQSAPTHKMYVEWDKGDVKIQCEATNATIDASERVCSHLKS